MKVFTMEYVPFVMGGNVWQPMCCEVEADGPHDLGDGYKGYVITAPNGKTFIAEETSGAFVGPDLKAVREDIETGDKSIMADQVADAVIQMKKAKERSQDHFWRKLKCK